MKSFLSSLLKLNRSNSKKQNRSLLSPFISRSIGISLHSWLLGISIVTAIPLVSIVSEVRPAQAGSIRSFTSRYRRQGNSTIRLIGNTNTTCSSSTSFSTTTIANNCSFAQNRTGLGGSSLNNNGNYIVNTNTLGGVFNSSSAEFTLPAGASIKFAGLYWGANTSAGARATDANNNTIILAGTAAPTPSDRNKIQFKVGTGTYQPITVGANSSTDNLDVNGNVYHAFKDVTSLVNDQAAGTARTYSVADIQTGLGTDRYSGWSLIIVYDDPAKPWRELNVFDGFATVGTNDPTNTTLSGFNVPASGSFNAEFGAFAYEGDMGTKGDTSSINNIIIGNATTATIKASDNFWDSSITSIDPTPYTRNPAYTNTLGIDISLFSLPTSGTSAPIKNGATSADLSFISTGDVYYPGAFTLAIDAAAISGRVFEDVNYGGGSGRDYATANTSATASGFALTVAASTSAANTTDRIGANGAIVELYDNNGSFVATTTTDAQGQYGFSQNIKIGTYSVRVVNSSVKSVRPGGSTATGLIPVQTFQTDSVVSTSNPIVSTATANTNLVGGKDPTKVDAPANTGSQNLSGIAAQSVSKVTVVENDSVPDTNFGFNFDTIVNTNDTGQGSLRQFILNSNALTNAKLDQDPNATPATGTTAINPAAGVETSILMIPDGNAHNGLPTTGSPNLLTNGVASIVPITALPIITDANTTIDGGTQTVNIGNTKTGAVGYAGIVGTNAANTLAGINNPEVVISNAHTLAAGLSATGDFFTVRGMSVYGFGTGNTVDDANILFAGTKQFLVEQSLIGIPSGGSPAIAPISGSFTSNYFGIAVKGAVSNITIQDNVIAQNGSSGLLLNTGVYTNVTIQRNEAAYNGAIDTANGDGITLANCTTSCLVQTNYLHDNQAYGLQDQTNTGLQVKTNTISNNGSGGTETAGIVVWGSTGTQVINNVISSNSGDGILIARNPTNSGQALGKTTKISQNSFFSNGKLGIDLAEATSNASIDYSAGQVVTPNNGLVGSTTANNGMDYPVITYSKLTSGSLQVKGFVGNVSAGSATFNAPTLEFFIADDDGNQNGAVILNDGRTKPHGEGKTFIGSCTATSVGLFDCTFSSASTTGLTTAKNITATAIDSSGNTSEFSSIPNAADVILIKRITKINVQTTNPNDLTKDLTAVVDNLATPNDDSTKRWPVGYLQGLFDAGNIKPNDTIEYTIYYLNDGNSNANAVKICDSIRGNQKYVSGTMKLSVSGATAISLTDLATDTTVDRAYIYGVAALPTVVTVPTDCNIGGTGYTVTPTARDNGGVAIQLTGTGATTQLDLSAIPGATAAGTTNSYGWFKFTTKVDP
jgi:Right handed beta helix region/SdrD B-like domain